MAKTLLSMFYSARLWPSCRSRPIKPDVNSLCNSAYGSGYRPQFRAMSAVESLSYHANRVTAEGPVSGWSVGEPETWIPGPTLPCVAPQRRRGVHCGWLPAHFRMKSALFAHETEAKNRRNYAGAPPGRRSLRLDPHRAGRERAANHYQCSGSMTSGFPSGASAKI
jgi:hypothetical protein